MEYIFVEVNVMSGTLPSELGLLENLKKFAGYSIGTLSGSIPTEFGLLGRLTDLSFDLANLTVSSSNLA